MPDHAALKPLLTPIADLIPYHRNTRIHAIEAYKESLLANGQYRPVVANRATREVLAGNGLLAAARELGWSKVAVVWVDVDEEQAARIVLADNRIAELGSLNLQALSELILDVGDLTGTGYEPADLSTLLQPPITGAGVIPQPDDDPDADPDVEYLPPVGESAYTLPWGFTREERQRVLDAVAAARAGTDMTQPAALAAVADAFLSERSVP